MSKRVALVTLGCARNDVDSEELAGRLAAAGWEVAAAADGDDAADADVVLVNTCGFIAQAKKDSVDTLLAAADGGATVVAAGCLAERYGAELADSLPEAAAVLSFDDYPDIAGTLDRIAAGERPASHQPRDRRRLLPIAPAARAAQSVSIPGHGQRPPHPGPVPTPPSGPRLLRRRLDGGPVAPLKLASGCDRRCTFCAIPRFRGAFVSRPPEEVLAEGRWLAAQGVRELVLVSENSTSYGKDLGDPRLLEALLPELAAIDGVVRVRLSYLQPAEMRPTLVAAIATTPGVAPYFDLSFQHSSESVLRAMRRFGSTESFLGLLDDIRGHRADAGVRTNVIVGFPGERRADVAELERFLGAARLDAVGVFGYSDEDGTEAVQLPGKVRADTRDRRLARITALAEELAAQRAEERVGTVIEVLIDSVADDHGSGGPDPADVDPADVDLADVDRGGADAGSRVVEGRAAHQAPEVDGITTVRLGSGVQQAKPGDLVRAKVVAGQGVDLVAVGLEVIDAAPTHLPPASVTSPAASTSPGMPSYAGTSR